MLDNNHKSKDCDWGEALVEYLYGEAAEKESAAFEAHLESCAACTQEMEAFSGVHFAISDWKSKEFDTIQTPAIEIPYEKAERQTEVSSVKESWLPAFIRDLFSLSPRGWTLATASFAVLVICAGVAFLTMKPQKRDDVAETNKNSRPAVVPTIEKTPEQTNVNKTTSTDREVKPLKEQNATQPELAVESNKKNNSRVVKAVETPRPTPKVDNTKNNDVKRNNKNNNETAPKVIPDDEEDDSLRLAELFEEIDTRED